MSGNSEPQITLELSEDGTYVATSSALPGLVVRAESEAAAIRKMRRAMKLHLREQERDFSRLGQRDEEADEPFRWSRWRVPLYLRPPLSRHVKLTLAAFSAGVVIGVSVFAVRRRRS